MYSNNIIVSFSGGGQTNFSHSGSIFFFSLSLHFIRFVYASLLTQRHLLFVLCVHKTVNDHGYMAVHTVCRIFFSYFPLFAFCGADPPPSAITSRIFVDFAYLFFRTHCSASIFFLYFLFCFFFFLVLLFRLICFHFVVCYCLRLIDGKY